MEPYPAPQQNRQRSDPSLRSRGRSSGLVLVLTLAVLGSALPPFLGWLLVGRAPTLSPSEASAFVRAKGSRNVLVDTRTPQAFAEASIEGSLSVPYAEIRALANADALPPALRGRGLVLICDGGVLSGQAALRLQSLGVPEVFSVRGGMQAWIAAASTGNSLVPVRAHEPGAAPAINPVVRLPVAEQAALLLALYSVKPLYMLLAAWLAIALWTKKSLVLAALRWSLVCFFIGELACWVNFQFFKIESITLEYIHSVSMTFFIAFLAWAMIEAVDGGLLHYSEPTARCALAGYCSRCRKSADVPCVLRRLFLLGCGSLAVLSLIPLTAQARPVSYNAGIFGLVRNLMHPVAVQLYEIRFAPLAAFLLFASAALLLAFSRPRGEQATVVLIAFGAGHLGFAFFRLAFLSFFADDLVLFVAWEEITELLMIAALVYALWVFRVELLPRLRPQAT